MKPQPMNERRILRTSILSFWTLFWGLSVLDKIIPDVHFLWVGKDFFALFVKFFGSLGLNDPLFATLALAAVSGLEAVNFTFYVAAMVRHLQCNEEATDRWFFRAILTSMVLFTLFSIADQVFGDRFQLLEHSLLDGPHQLLMGFMPCIRTPMAMHPEGNAQARSGAWSLTLVVCVSVSGFSSRTFSNTDAPVHGTEGRGCIQIDFPFLRTNGCWKRLS